MQALLSRVLSKGVLVVWVVTSAVIGAYVLGGHLTTLPAPDAGDPALAQGLRALFPRAGAAATTAVHVLYDRCGCSARVADALRTRKPRPGLREAVVMVADDPAAIEPDALATLRGAGFPVITMKTAEVAARLHVEAVPFLVVLDGEDRIRYAGGYTAARERPDLQDGRLIAEVQAGGLPAALPVFGCATASELQQKLDPFGIKY